MIAYTTDFVNTHTLNLLRIEMDGIIPQFKSVHIKHVHRKFYSYLGIIKWFP